MPRRRRRDMTRTEVSLRVMKELARRERYEIPAVLGPGDLDELLLRERAEDEFWEWSEAERTRPAARQPAAVATYTGPRPPADELARRVRAYLATIEPAVSGQRGHDRTFRAACKLVIEFNLSPEDAFPFLAEWNQDCKPPWSDRELWHKLHDADKRNEPRGGLLADRHNPTPGPSCAISSVANSPSPSTDEFAQATSEPAPPPCKCKNPYRVAMTGWGKNAGRYGVFGVACRKLSCSGCRATRTAEALQQVRDGLDGRPGPVIVWRGRTEDWNAARMALSRSAPGKIAYAAVAHPDGDLAVVVRGATPSDELPATDAATAITTLKTACQLLPIEMPKGFRPFRKSRNWALAKSDQLAEVGQGAAGDPDKEPGGWKRAGNTPLTMREVRQRVEAVGLSVEDDVCVGGRVSTSLTWNTKGRLTIEEAAELMADILDPLWRHFAVEIIEPPPQRPWDGRSPLKEDLEVPEGGAA